MVSSSGKGSEKSRRPEEPACHLSGDAADWAASGAAAAANRTPPKPKPEPEATSKKLLESATGHEDERRNCLNGYEANSNCKQNTMSQNGRSRPPRPPRQHQRRTSNGQPGEAGSSGSEEPDLAPPAVLSPSAPSPPPPEQEHVERRSNGNLERLPGCCQGRERRLQAIQSEVDALRTALRSANQNLAARDELHEQELTDARRMYDDNLTEMSRLQAAQNVVAQEVQTEQDRLIANFRVTTQRFKEERDALVADLARVRVEYEEKEQELREAEELNGVYTAKLTKMERKFKKLKDEDEESYMEMTF